MVGSMFGAVRAEGHGRTVRFERNFQAPIDEIWAACTVGGYQSAPAPRT